MADEISTAEPHGADTAKRDVETVEQTPAKTADATPSVPSGTMDPAHRVRVERALAVEHDGLLVHLDDGLAPHVARARRRRGRAPQAPRSCLKRRHSPGPDLVHLGG